MKVIKVSNTKVECAKATVVKSKTNELRYKIILGSEGDGIHPYLLGLDTRYFKPESMDDVLSLDGDNFIIKEVRDRVTKKPMTLPCKKKLFTISKSNAHTFPTDSIVIWEIPNNRYRDVTYELNGDVELLVEGGNIGKIRNDIAYTSPTLLLEIYGNCELRWKGVDKNGNIVYQTVVYKYESNEFNISTIETEKGDKKDASK